MLEREAASWGLIVCLTGPPIRPYGAERSYFESGPLENRKEKKIRLVGDAFPGKLGKGYPGSLWYYF